MGPQSNQPFATTASAALWRRAAGYLIDSTIAFGLVGASQLWLLTRLREGVGIDSAWFHSGWNTQLYTLLTISLPVWAWFAAGDSVWRGVGRAAVGIRVVRCVPDTSVSFARAFGRAAVKLAPWEIAHLANNLPTPMWYADDPGLRALFPVSGGLFVAWGLTMALRRDRRGPHDLLAGTRVVGLSRGAR